MKGVLYVRGLPDDLKRVFKTTAVRRDDDMTSVIEALMMLYTEDPTVISKHLHKVEKRRHAMKIYDYRGDQRKKADERANRPRPDPQQSTKAGEERRPRREYYDDEVQG